MVTDELFGDFDCFLFEESLDDLTQFEVVYFAIETGVWNRVSHVAVNVFRDEVEAKELPPSIDASGVNIVPDEVGALVG